MSKSIKLNITSKKKYEVLIGYEGWDLFLEYCRKRYSERKIFVLVDENVFNLYNRQIKQQCERYFRNIHLIKIPPGETSKSLKVWKQLVSELLEAGIERTTPVLAIGGGVTGDVAGFAAASALRGVPLIHMPTSLLAMVDSSIGGKTGVNHPAGKNLIGAFYQPDVVFCHLPFLETLPETEWVNGLAEMLKYAAISNPELFGKLQKAVNSGFTPDKKWEQLIYESAKIKCEIVEADTYESGKRTFLNFGHTFGHALENVTGYKTVSHGEAVFAGMFAAVYLSQKFEAPVQMARFSPFKPLYNIALPQDKIETLVDAMHSDKKVENGSIRIILLKKWGKPYLKTITDRKMLAEAWLAAFEELKN